MMLVTRLIWVVCVLVLSGPLYAQSLRVAVVGNPYIARAEPDKVQSAQDDLVRHAMAQIRATRGFTSFGPEDLSQRLQRRPSYQDSLRLAASWSEMGITKYRELDPAGAIQSLEQAVNIYRAAGFDLVEPAQFAQILLYLSLSYLELERDLARPLELMQEMIRLDPSIALQDGYYSQSIVQFYVGALLTFERSVRDATPGRERADRILGYSNADAVLFLDTLPTADGFQVIAHYAEGSRMTFSKEVVEVNGMDDFGEAASRLVSRFLSCRLEPEPAPPPIAESKGQSPWSVQLSFAYASFLEFPDPKVELFGHYGAALGASYSMTREFAVLAGVQVLTSMRDYSGFLADDFTTIRGFGGVELGYSFGPIRPEIAVLIETSTIGDISVCEDVNSIVRGCDSRQITTYEFELLLGANIRPRVSVQLLPSLNALVGGSGSFYVYPLSQRRLNFPLTIETGLQYRF